jgi:hypothetical protein
MQKVSMMKKIILFIYILISASAFSLENKYSVFISECSLKGKSGHYATLRRLIYGSNEKFLTVNLDSLKMHVFSSNEIVFKKSASSAIALPLSPYVKLLKYSLQRSVLRQNAGIIRIDVTDGDFLTADLCQSRHPFDKSLIQGLSDMIGYSRPIPIAFAVTGKWIVSHKSDLEWIIKRETAGDIRITWINHSFSHHKKIEPMLSAFLADPGIDFEDEILKGELAMIKAGLVPSVFFRFPGLVSTRERFIRAVELGVIPIGSDAWLGKNQSPRGGSIILIHANGNEPIGIKKFFYYVSLKKQDSVKGMWKLLDLGDTMAVFSKNMR